MSVYVIDIFMFGKLCYELWEVVVSFDSFGVLGLLAYFVGLYLGSVFTELI